VISGATWAAAARAGIFLGVQALEGEPEQVRTGPSIGRFGVRLLTMTLPVAYGVQPLTARWTVGAIGRTLDPIPPLRSIPMRRSTVLLSLFILASAMTAEAQPATPSTPATPAIKEGSRVQLEYTLSEASGEVLDSNTGGDALTYVQGQQQLIPGLERALAGMRAGEAKRVTVAPAEAYGPVDPKAETEVPKEQIPPAALTVGTALTARNSTGQTRVVRVKEVRERTVLLDLNHPLAGKTLYFDVRVLGVQPPPE
jgi:FKBP-type peptidyl-prolyl cis-trans isomerase SlyD